MPEKEEIIAQILAIELEMFLSVPTAEPASCQQHPDQFMLHRKSQFSAWRRDVLTSYLGDLQRAQRRGENLMTMKYARMDNLIESRVNSLIDEIAVIQYAWQKDMFEKYPGILSGARPLSSSDDTLYKTSFETYLRGELETYSDETIRLLHAQVLEMRKNNRNMNEEVYACLVKQIGYSSLEEAEKTAVSKTT
ncbi:MAG: DUF4125 family protein [Deltaproteobacteria bacterium]|nr:DUF4125 family protein [Deltaproteobacteria bacterium]